MPGIFRSGSAGRIVFGTASIARVTRWRAYLFTRLIDNSDWNIVSGNLVWVSSGCLTGDVTLDFDWDLGAFPFSFSNTQPRQTSLLTLYGDKTNALTAFAGTGIAESIDLDTAVRDKLKGTWKGKFTGFFTKPTV